MPPIARDFRLGCLLLLLVAAAWLTPARAGQVQTSTSATLRMTVDTRWAPGPAYRHVLVTLTPLGATARDRVLEIEFLMSRMPGRERYDERVVQAVEIPAGSGPVQLSMAVPQSMQHMQQGFYQVNVLEDGKPIKALTQPWSRDQDFSSLGLPSPPPQFLVVSRKNLNLGTMRRALLEAAGISNGQARTVINNVPYAVGVPTPVGSAAPVATTISDSLGQTAAPEELPSRWIEYSNYDLVLISLDDFAQLREKQPESCRALVRWASAGGNLVVWGVGKHWERLGELERLTNLTSADAVSSPETAGDPQTRGWVDPSASQRKSQEKATGSSQEPASPSPSQKSLIASLGQQLDESLRDAPVTPELSGPSVFVYHPLATGVVVAWGDADPGQSASAQWHSLYTALGAARMRWDSRHGLAMYGDNQDFWDFLIPGVGLAPVGMFRVLISLFVVVIGPANYFLLRRWRRLHLLVITVPVCAGLVTGVLLTYAIAADGFATRVRVRSYTWLDQQAGEAVCWSRLSYYAGLTPGHGLTFSPDIVVLPYSYEAIGYGSFLDRELLWEDQQRLARGWLAARTPTQFITVRAAASSRRLRIQRSPQTPRSVTIENQLGTPVSQLLIRDPEGRYYWAEQMVAGATTTAAPIPEKDGLDRMSAIARRHQPSTPFGGVPGQVNGRRRSPWQPVPVSDSKIVQQTNRLEASLRKLNSGQAGSGIEPGQFMAVVEASPEVELGISSARQEASFHVIQGTW